MAGTLTKPTPRALSTWFNRAPLATVWDEMQDVFGDIWKGGEELSFFTPRLDVSETDTALQVRMDLPGVDPNDIDVQVNGNQLTISGERKEEREEKGKTLHRIERRTGRFSRSMLLPCEVDEDKIDAACREGILTMTLPKTEQSKTRHIKVKT